MDTLKERVAVEEMHRSGAGCVGKRGTNHGGPRRVVKQPEVSL